MKHRQHMRVYRALLLLFPRWFRRQYGSQMERLFDRMWHERRQAARFGGMSWLSFWMTAFADVTREAAQAHWGHVEYLAGLIEGEALDRQQRAIGRRIRLRAGRTQSDWLCL